MNTTRRADDTARPEVDDWLSDCSRDAVAEKRRREADTPQARAAQEALRLVDARIAAEAAAFDAWRDTWPAPTRGVVQPRYVDRDVDGGRAADEQAERCFGRRGL